MGFRPLIFMPNIGGFALKLGGDHSLWLAVRRHDLTH